MSANAQPPATGRREWKKRQKRGRIITAARELFYAQGYRKTTTQQIAQAANVASGTLFLYAKSKEELMKVITFVSEPDKREYLLEIRFTIERKLHQIVRNAQASGVLGEKADALVIARILFRVYFYTMLFWLGSYGDHDQRDEGLRDLVRGVLSLASVDAGESGARLPAGAD